MRVERFTYGECIHTPLVVWERFVTGRTKRIAELHTNCSLLLYALALTGQLVEPSYHSEIIDDIIRLKREGKAMRKYKEVIGDIKDILLDKRDRRFIIVPTERNYADYFDFLWWVKRTPLAWAYVDPAVVDGKDKVRVKMKLGSTRILGHLGELDIHDNFEWMGGIVTFDNMEKLGFKPVV